MTWKLPSHRELLEQLSYNKDTGIFTWNVKPAKNIPKGAVAGHLHKSGYIYIKINGEDYLAHRLAWLYVTGLQPSKEHMDHINGVKNDNRFCNLRECSNAENQFNRGKQINNTSGYKGVTRHQGKYLASATLNGKSVYIGIFKTPEEAVNAYNEYCKEHHGDFCYV